MRERGSRWLAQRMLHAEREGREAESLDALCLSIVALARADIEDTAAPLLLERVRSAQAPDGSFGSGASSAATTRWAVAALRTSGLAADVQRAERALDSLASELEGARTPVAESLAGADAALDAAMDFLGAGGGSELHAGRDASSVAISLLAGGSFDRRRAYRHLRREASSSGLARTLGLANPGGGPQDVHVAARVLASYGSPRMIGEDGVERAWPELLLHELADYWDAGVGAWRPRAGAPPDAPATACALLALDALEPWTSLVGARVDASLDGAQRPAELRSDCEDCHQKLQPGLHAQWQASRHASAGVDCAACHGLNHSTIFREEGRVSAATCAKCHPREAEEFARSRHARAMATLIESSLFDATPPAARESCIGCHATGTVHVDGNVGSCNYCHPAHGFDAALAREPEACTSCHTGGDYPQDEAYRLSKHGALYFSNRDPALAPTCAGCHMPRGTHDDGFGITIGGSGTGGILAGETPPIEMRVVGAEEFIEERSAMIGVCSECHSSRFARDSLERADRVKAEGDRFLAQAAAILRGLHADGLLESEPGITLHLGGQQVAIGPETAGGAILDRFYAMWRFHYNSSWKGAYHCSPSVANHGSGPGVEDDLRFIRAEASRLRQSSERAQRGGGER